MSEASVQLAEEHQSLDTLRHPAILEVSALSHTPNLSTTEPGTERIIGERALLLQSSDTDGTKETVARMAEDSFVVGALDQVWSKVAGWKESIQKRTSRKGAITLASIAVATPFAIKEFLQLNPVANAAEVMRDVEEGVRDCSTYVMSVLRQKNIPEERLQSAGYPDFAKEQFELIDRTPAAGATAYFNYIENGRKVDHIMFIESVSGDQMVISDCCYEQPDGSLKSGTFSMSIESFLAKNDATVIHYELPPTANGAFVGARRDPDWKSNTFADTKQVDGLAQQNYIESPDGNRVLVFNNNLAVYNKTNGFTLDWQTHTKSNVDQYISIVPNPKGKGNLLVQRKADARSTDPKNWLARFDIGSATALKLENDGSISGHKGKRKLWNAASLTSAPRAAKAAVRKEALLAKKQRALAAKRSRSARQTKTATQNRAANKKINKATAKKLTRK